jgi:hypothetical protein
MKQIKNMSQIELAAFIQSRLKEAGIDVILSGGSAVSFYSSDQYVSKDLDLINVKFARRKDIKSIMEKLGFLERGRYFTHLHANYLVEFPDGPLSVGEEPVKEIKNVSLSTGTLRVISATDCVKDRLCAFYFWKDQQGLAQAVLVSQSQKVDIKEIRRWSKAERKEQEFEVFRKKLV